VASAAMAMVASLLFRGGVIASSDALNMVRKRNISRVTQQENLQKSAA